MGPAYVRRMMRKTSLTPCHVSFVGVAFQHSSLHSKATVLTKMDADWHSAFWLGSLEDLEDLEDITSGIPSISFVTSLTIWKKEVIFDCLASDAEFSKAIYFLAVWVQLVSTFMPRLGLGSTTGPRLGQAASAVGVQERGHRLPDCSKELA